MNEKISALISSRFKEERERLGLTQQEMAKAGNVAPRTLQGWESGSFAPKAEFLAQAATFGVNVDYVITGKRNLSHSIPAPASSEDTIYIPLLYASASMGTGSEVTTEDVIMGDVPLSIHWLRQHLPKSRPAALRLIHAYGDSMQGTLNSGDFGVCDTDKITADVDGIYVLEAHGRLFIKRVTQRMDGRHEVTSDNPNVRTVDVLNGEHQVRICGRIVYGWNGRRF